MIKRLLISLFLIPSLVHSQDQDSVKTSIDTFLNEWHAAATKADMKAYFEKIDEKGIYIGTDATEYWTKNSFYSWSKPFFDKGKAWTFKAVQRNIYLSDDKSVAWFDEKLEASRGMLRGSGVMRKNDGKWTIMQYVLSLPVPNEKFKEVQELISKR